MATLCPSELKAPPYAPPVPIDSDTRPKIGLAVESMRRHMTDEGWQIFDGLQYAGYDLWGYNLPPRHSTHVPLILLRSKPSVCVVQDKREWDTRPGDFREKLARFHDIECLQSRPDVFKVTILKDAHQRAAYHAQSAREMGCHAWIVYYNTETVKRLAPYVRADHLIRTFHTVDKMVVPAYAADNRRGCLLSGAVSSVYPLRQRLIRGINLLTETTYLRHPGYHMAGTQTPKFISLLSQFKVAVCTASVFGYALRKIVEATAAGCMVITDLPESDTLPEIDGNLYRVPAESTLPFVNDTIRRLLAEYNPERQKYYADCALAYYDYREEGRRLSERIDALRGRYPCG